MTVSVVIPSLNQAAFLEQAIESVLRQRGVQVELLVVDGGSSDGSTDIIRRHTRWLKYWTSEPDSGQSDAINKGWARASGEVLAWLNADDFYLDGALKTAEAYLDSAPSVGVVYGDCVVVDERGGEAGRQAPTPFDFATYALECNNYIPSGSAFLRREVVRAVGPLRTDLHFLMDQDYWLRCGLVTSLRAIPDTLSCFRVYPEAKTWSGGAQRAAELKRVLCGFADRDDLPEELRKARNRLRARAHVGAAARSLEAGDVWSFWRDMLTSVAYEPVSCTAARVRVFRDGIRRRLAKGATLVTT